MARYASSVTKTTGAAIGIIAEIKTGAAKDSRVWEVGVFANTAVSGTIGLGRPATASAGTATGNLFQAEDTSAGAATVQLNTSYATTSPLIGANISFRQAVLPATIGAGVIWTFPQGIVVPTAAGLLIHQISTAAVTYTVYAVLDE